MKSGRNHPNGDIPTRSANIIESLDSAIRIRYQVVSRNSISIPMRNKSLGWHDILGDEWKRYDKMIKMNGVEIMNCAGMKVFS